MTAVLEDAQELKVSKWGTLNTAASPQRLPEGHSPNNQNVWMDEKPGSVVTANGYTLLGSIPGGNPATFGIDFFKASDGSSKFVVSDGQTVWWTTDFTTYTSIITGLSEFFQLRGAVIRDKLWLTNGSDAVRTWDGTTVTVLDGTAGTPNVPKGRYIAYHDERVWLYGIDGDFSSLCFSALANSSGTEIAPDNASAWPSDNQLQISEGDADVGTGMWLYRGYLYCSKQYSIWRIVGSDEYDYTRVKTRASTGTRFQESVQIKDNLVHFIGVDGGYVFDGEEAKRITDIIDPSSPGAGVFAFRNLQQPLLNTQFWNVSVTADFAAGLAVPTNLSTTGDELRLIPTDDSAADFAAGTTLTNVTATDNLGSVQLSHSNSGFSNINVVSAQPVTVTLDSAVAKIGSESSLTDGVLTSAFGFSGANAGHAAIPFSVTSKVTTIVLRGLVPGLSSGGIRFQATLGGPSSFIGMPLLSTSYGTIDALNQTVNFPSSASATDVTVTFTAFTADRIVLNMQSSSGIVMTELEVYSTAYESIGQFISKPLDYEFTVSAPATFGVLFANETLNGGFTAYFTQSSDDSITWDGQVSAFNGMPIGSTPRRYLRWGVNMLPAASGITTPVVSSVYVGGTYISEVHNTGGNIFRYAAFAMAQNKGGQTINAYYRANPTSIGILVSSWIPISPGALMSIGGPGDDYVQVKLELSMIDGVQAPSVQSFTANWIVGTGTGVNTLQNVASIVWLNRYWLSAATLGSDFNDIVIVLGKSTYGSPWHKKDFKILMFCRYQGILIGGSSTNGSLYRLEYGYSKDGYVMDSYYETADFSNETFQLKGRELIVTADRSGPYNLSVGWSTDGGLTYTEKDMDLTRASGESLSVTKKLNINYMSDSVRFRVRINEADQPFSVDEMKSYYRLSPQRGSIGS